MIVAQFNYAIPSVLDSTRERDLVGLSADTARPVRFLGRLRSNVLSVRFALSALGGLIASEQEWSSDGEQLSASLDPIVSVTPDRIVWEGFSRDLGAIGVFEVPRSVFETRGEVREGTTNVDFSAWFAAAVNELRSSRETWLGIAPDGLELRTVHAGGRYEPRVELPESWLRGLLSAQAAMAMPGTRLSVRPVDLLAAIRWLQFKRAKVSPRGLRWVMAPGEYARLILEPWETEVRLKGATHGYTETRTIRTWGRRQLRLIEPLLPLAESVTVYLKGRALPVFVVVELPGCRFTLGFGTAGLGGLDLLSSDVVSELGAEAPAIDEALVEQVLEALTRSECGAAELALRLGRPGGEVEGALQRLVRLGRAAYDLGERRYRHRELFYPPISPDRLTFRDPRLATARFALSRGEVTEVNVEERETRKTRRLPGPDGPVTRELVFRDHVINGRVGAHAVSVVLDAGGKLIFGTCGCDFFRTYTLGRGPCSDMLALRGAAAPLLRDGPSSAPALAPPPDAHVTAGGAALDNGDEEEEE